MIKQFFKILIEPFQLLWLAINNSFYNMGLALLEMFVFFNNPKLRKVAFALFKQYALVDPYRISSNEASHININRDNLIYGETPWYSIHKILKYINPGPNDVFYDLGSGRGKVAFFVSVFFKIKAIGIDLIPTFIKNSENLQKQLNLDDVKFTKGNFIDMDISDGTIFYIAGTCFDDDMIDAVLEKIKQLNDNSWVITLSYPLNSPHLTLEKTLILPYSWGKGTVFIQKKVS